MTKKNIGLLCFLLVSLGYSLSSYAVSVQYSLSSLGGNNYRFDYTLINDGSLGAGVALELLDINFDPALYLESSLHIVSSPSLSSDWNQGILSSSLSVPAAFDIYALTGGVADGASLGGFSVEFTWLGPAGPTAQSFEVFDPLSFTSLETGTTTVVPLPGTFWLMLSGLLGLVRWHKRRM